MAIDLHPDRVIKSAPARALHSKIVADIAEAETLRPEWERLLERAERRELTQTPDWLLTWWRVYGGGSQLRLGVFQDGERVVGLAPFLRRRHWYRGCLPFRRLEFLASGEPLGDGICSNHLTILAESGAEARVARSFVDALRTGAFGSWDEVILPMMAADTPMPELLVEAFHTAGLHADVTALAGARYIPLPATWDEYLKSLSKNSRRNIERSIQAFDKWADGTMTLECLSTPNQVQEGKAILMKLHRERWARDDQTGVFTSPLFLRFHEAMMPLLAERGALELLVLRAHGEPAAVVYNMKWADKVYTYQGGRRTDLPAHLSPGGVLDALAIRRAIEQGLREFDLLADDMFYKKQLTPHMRPLVQVRAARRSVVEALRRFGVSWRASISDASKKRS